MQTSDNCPFDRVLVSTAPARHLLHAHHGAPQTVMEESLADLLVQLILTVGLRPGPLPLPIPHPPGGIARHSLEHKDNSRRPQATWYLEAETPRFERPQNVMELQVWHRERIFRFHGTHAIQRLRCIAPTFFAAESKGRVGAIGVYTLDENLCLMTTGQSLARSLQGSSGWQGSDLQIADTLLAQDFRLPKRIAGEQKNRRFFECLSEVFTVFRIFASFHNNRGFLRLRNLIIQDMLKFGRCESPITLFFLQSLNVLMRGCANNTFEKWLLSHTPEERAFLWKSRRNFTKDDNLPLLNAQRAIDRMVIPRTFTDEQEQTAHAIFALYERKATQFVETHIERLRTKHNTVALHRSSASLFFSREAGGGGGEMALTVALYRLSRGYSTPLTDVWGSVPDNLSIQGMLERLQTQDEHRAEVLEACDWFLDEIQRREVSFPILCIYPEREVKSRSFMMLPYALQQGGIQAATVLSEFLKTQTDTSEVYNGFNTPSLISRMQSDIRAGADTILSLDSAVATDSLPHALCLRVYRPFYPVFSAFTIKALERIFAPTRVHVAKRRPKSYWQHLDYACTVFRDLTPYLIMVDPDPTPMEGHFLPFRVHEDNVPSFIRTYDLRKQVVETLEREHRVMMVSPTGSGKTLLAATLFNAIIQFPSVASLEIFSISLKTLEKPHNVWHARSKEIEHRDYNGEPRTILCTCYFVEILARRYPHMVVVLDEADSKQEQNLLNLLWTRQKSKNTLIMTATPEELRGEEFTHRINLSGGTNFPVEERSCSLSDMMLRLATRQYPQSLICTYSEPHCQKLAQELALAGRKTIALTAQRRQQDYAEDLRNADVIISTNVVRSSVTLPDLIEVFDLGRNYETVDFPLAGVESLVLMEVSAGMRKQLLGRVGRMQPGVYWRVHGVQRPAEPYSPMLLARMPKIAALLATTPLKEFARDLNVGSLLVDRYHQLLCERRLGIRMERDKPLWATIIKKMGDGRANSLLAFIHFDASGIVGRLQSIKDEDELAETYEEFRHATPMNLENTMTKLRNRLYHSGWFASDFNALLRWGGGTKDDDPDAPLFSEQNMRAVVLAMWRNVATSQKGLLVGRYRSFSVSMPTRFGMKAGEHGLVIGLGIAQTTLTARATLPIPQSVIDWFDQLAAPNHQIHFAVPCQGVFEKIPILNFSQTMKNKGAQQRNIHLHWDSFSTVHTFDADNYEQIWDAMMLALHSARDSDDQITTQGSPMSSTASFTVLNAFGLAVHNWVREQTQEKLFSASIFGDDDIVVGSERACLLDEQGREACGLRTKQEATGRISLAPSTAERDNQLIRSRAFALFTERVLDPVTLQEVESYKPRGVFRLFQAYHSDQVMTISPAYAPDMQHFAAQLKNRNPALSECAVGDPTAVSALHAVRITAPRRILRNALLRDLGPHDRVAEGDDVERLFNALESSLLLYYPSTRGAPDRMETVVSHQPYGHPLIGYDDACRFAKILQGKDCYFKLRGPPLRFRPGPFAIEAASAELKIRGKNPYIYATPKERFFAVGWGNPHKQSVPTPDDNVEYLLPEIDPIDFWDSTE